MSDRRQLLGYAIYNPDHDDENAHMVCVDCDDDPDPGEGMDRAAVRDSPAYGSDVPYPECRRCGEVMRPGSPDLEV